MSQAVEVEELANRMRRAGIERVAFHPDGRVAELVLGHKPPASEEPVDGPPRRSEPPKPQTEIDVKRARAAEMRSLALHGHGVTQRPSEPRS